MKLYVYTIPKAGTYFMAEFLERLGFRNTGFHVSRNHFLNTAKLDMDTNIRFPGKAREKQLFVKTLNQLAENEVAFGHFAVPLMGWVFPALTFICVYRHPRKTLVSEFIDFRFRREDVAWISRETVADDQKAFCAYLERHGPVQMNIFSQMLGVTLLLREDLCVRYDSNRNMMLNFDHLLRDPEEAGRIAKALGLPAERGRSAREETLTAETKTKATNLTIDREALWSPQAEDLYYNLRAEDYVRRGRELGWEI